MDDKSIDDIVVDEKEFFNYMRTNMKAYQQQIRALSDHYNKIAEMIQDIGHYETSGYKIKYFFNEKTQSYSYEVNEKPVIGFKK